MISKTLLKKAINVPILDKIGNYLAQSGYTYISFENLKMPNIEIQNIKYIFALTIKKNIHLGKFIKCLSSVFNIIEGDLTNTSERIFLRYKRVSNYNPLESQEAFVNDMRKKGVDFPTIKQELMENFQLQEKEAAEKMASWAGNVKTERNLFENKTFTIRTNTGFPITIRRNKQNFETTISVENIDNIHYIAHIRIYIESLLRMFLDKGNTGVPAKTITKLCKGKAVLQDIIEEDDIQADPEKNLLSRKSATINNNKVTFNDDDEEQMAFLNFLAGRR